MKEPEQNKPDNFYVEVPWPSDIMTSRGLKHTEPGKKYDVNLDEICEH